MAQVRSCTLDTWLPEQVAFMDHTGNAKANAYYEAKLDPSEKPSYYSPDLEAFIRRKVFLPPNPTWVIMTQSVSTGTYRHCYGSFDCHSAHPICIRGNRHKATCSDAP